MGGIYEAENTEEQPGGDQPYLGRETGADLRHLSEAGALTIKVAQDLGIAHSDTRNQFGNLRVKNAIDCVGRCKDGYLYMVHREDAKSYREQLEEVQSDEASSGRRR